MKKRSFRLRLALISMGLSGLVLLVFGLVAWWALSQSQLRSLDAELKTFGYRFAGRSGAKVDGPRQEESMIDIFGADGAQYRFFTLLSNDKETLYRTKKWPEGLDSKNFPASNIPLDPQPEVVPPPPKKGDQRSGKGLRTIFEPRFYTTDIEGRRYRLGVFANPSIILICGADLDQFSRELLQLRNAFLAALPGALLVIALGAWWLGRKALRPIEVLGKDMEGVSAKQLDQRLATSASDVEFAQIIETYNSMLERLQRSFQQAVRFSADASHELKTPLAIMRGTLERGLVTFEGNAAAQEVFSELLEQTGRQAAILESLLLLSRADAGKLAISVEKFNLSQKIEIWLEDASLLGESRDIKISSDIEPGIEIEGDLIMLQQVAHNLFSNAVRYNLEGGEIVCALCRVEGDIEWSVANTGESIAEEDRERIFDRFERNLSLQESHEEGMGLGLSLAREIVIAHGGQIIVSDFSEGMTGFKVILPQ